MIPAARRRLSETSVYLVNDLLDLSADRARPTKRTRPFASGALPVSHGIALAPLLALGGLVLGLAFATPLFVAVLAAYCALTFGYSLVLKHLLVIDIITLATLYSMPRSLWLVCPILLFRVIWMVTMASRGRMSDDPLVFAMRDRDSLAAVALAGLVVLFASVF